MAGYKEYYKIVYLNDQRMMVINDTLKPKKTKAEEKIVKVRKRRVSFL
tara:strand:- start:289 stop:432 length:144 start_codon:yes stop_codon:yes gene_type:complete